MSFKKKIFVTLLSLMCVLAVAFGFAACTPGTGGNTPGGGNTGDNPGGNTPGEEKPGGEEVPGGFEEGWTFDGDYHWHASKDGSDLVDGKALHSWKEQTSLAVAATCVSAGSKTFKCEVCEKSKTETIAQLSHNWSEQVETKDATCTAAGFQYKVCTNPGCSETTTVKFLPANGHKAEPATCTQPSVCEECKVTVAPALEHDYVEVRSTEATCEKEGRAYYECSHKGCDASYNTVTEKAKGHNILWDEAVGSEPVFKNTKDVCYEITFTAQCDDCDHTETKKTVVKDHVLISSIAAAATCSTPGTMVQTCTKCEYHSEDVSFTDANAHEWNAGTTAGGITTFTCVHNGQHTKTAVVSNATSDSFKADTLKTAGEVTLADTSIKFDEGVKNTLGGSEEVTLSADKLSVEELQDVNLNGSDASLITQPVFNLTLHNGKENVSDLGGTVTVTVPYALEEGEDPNNIIILYIGEEGLEEVSGKYSNGFVSFETTHFSYYTVTRMSPEERCDKFGHAYSEYHEDASCLIDGYTMKYCTRCGRNERENIPALGHDWETTAQEATCTTAGSAKFECKNCDAKYDIVTPASGHSFTATVFEDATCEHSGHATYKCDNCTETYNTTFAQKAHSFKSTVIKATCTEAGYTQNVCINCGHENVTDHVKALGHKEVSKTVAPTCTVDGFTLTYCSVCEEEISKSNVVKAAGHTMQNGVCTVCKYGCEHNYVKGTPVAATCTTDGYVPYTCTKCDSGYKGDIVKATGHSFEIEACKTCGEPNPAYREYYLNFIKTTLEGNVSITVTDFSFSTETRYYVNGTLTEKEHNLGASQIDVATLTFALSANGEITGAGKGSVHVDIEENDSAEFECEFAIKNGFVYIIMECDNPYAMPSSVMSLTLDYLLDNMFGGAIDYATLRSYLVWFNTDVNNVLEGLIKENSDIVADVLKFVLDKAFNRTATANGYTYTLDFDGVAALNEMLYEKTVSEIVDALLGEDSFSKLPDVAKAMLEATPDVVIEYLESLGLNKEQVFTAVDAFMFMFTGEEFDSKAKFEEILETVAGAEEQLCVAEIIMLYMTEGEAPDKATCVKQLSDMVNEYLEQYKDLTVYDIVSMHAFNGEPAAKDLFDMVTGYIDIYLPMAKESVEITFTTDKAGNVKSFAIDAAIEDLVVGGSVSDRPVNPDDKEEEPADETHTEFVLSANGKVEFAFGEQVTIDQELINKVVAAKPVFAKNSVITAYSQKELEKQFDKEYPDILTYRRGEEIIIHTDAKGNIVKIIETSEEVQRHIMQVWTNYYNCYEYTSSRIIEYTVNESTLVMVSKNYCGDIDMYTYIASAKYYEESYSYNRRIHRQTQTILRDTVENHDINERESRYMGVTFYYNSAEKQFVAQDPHYDLRVDEQLSKIECGGFYYMKCKDCGYHYNRSIYHLDENYHNNRVYKLKPGATNCEQGVIVSHVCNACDKAVNSYETKGHETFVKEEIELTEFGAKCEHTIKLYGCACGYYEYTYWRHGNYGNWDSFGNNFDSMMYEGTFTYKGDKNVRVYTCSVTECAFSFGYYTDSFTDENNYCATTWYEHLLFNVKLDEKTNTITSATEYDGELPYSYGYRHTTDTLRTDLKDGYIEEYKCTVCGLMESKREYHETFNANKQPVKTVEIYTWYKNDVKDNTEREVERREQTYEYSGEILVKSVRTEYRYMGAMLEENLESIYENIEIHNFDSEGKEISCSNEEKWYNGDGHLSSTRKHVYDVVWVDGDRFTFITERLDTNDYYNKEDGSYSEEPSRWHKYEYDYKTNGYCRPMITESTQAGTSDTRPGNVSHRPHGDMVTEPTCTQQGTRHCAFCDDIVQDGGIRGGHEYENGKCRICGLENNNVDGRVVLEDLSYRSETEYVIGYYNYETSMYTISVWLVNPENGDERPLDELHWIDSNQYAEELDYYRSGTISFSVDEIIMLAERYGFENYMIRVIFVAEFYDSQLDFAITIDAHNWVDGTLIREAYVNGEWQQLNEPVKYCSVCGMVHGFGYVIWENVSEVEGELVYMGYKHNFGGVQLIATTPIQDMMPEGGGTDGEIIFNIEYRFISIMIIENGEDVTDKYWTAEQLEEARNNNVVVFNEDGTCLFDGDNFKYSNGEMTNGEITVKVQVNAKEIVLVQTTGDNSFVQIVYAV